MIGTNVNLRQRYSVLYNIHRIFVNVKNVMLHSSFDVTSSSLLGMHVM